MGTIFIASMLNALEGSRKTVFIREVGTSTPHVSPLSCRARITFASAKPNSIGNPHSRPPLPSKPKWHVTRPFPSLSMLTTLPHFPITPSKIHAERHIDYYGFKKTETLRSTQRIQTASGKDSLSGCVPL